MSVSGSFCIFFSLCPRSEIQIAIVRLRLRLWLLGSECDLIWLGRPPSRLLHFRQVMKFNKKLIGKAQAPQLNRQMIRNGSCSRQAILQLIPSVVDFHPPSLATLAENYLQSWLPIGVFIIVGRSFFSVLFRFWPIVWWALLGTLAAINCLNARTQMQIFGGRNLAGIHGAAGGGRVAGGAHTHTPWMPWRQRSDSRFEPRVANFSQSAIVSDSVAVCTLIQIFIHDHITREELKVNQIE